MTEIAVHINARNLPSAWCRANGVTHLGLSRGKEIVGAVSTDRPEAEFDLTVDVVRKPDAFDFRGKYVFGKPGERFLYLNWTGGSGAGRIKLQLLPVDGKLIEDALDGGTLVADLELTSGKGGPVYASVRPPALTWRYEP